MPDLTRYSVLPLILQCDVCEFVVTMLRCYGIDVVLLYDDRVGAVFSPIIDKISNSRRLTILRPSDVNVTSPQYILGQLTMPDISRYSVLRLILQRDVCEFIVIMLHCYEINVVLYMMTEWVRYSHQLYSIIDKIRDSQN